MVSFYRSVYGLGTPVKPLKKLVQSGLLGWPLKVTISAHTGFNWKFFWVGKEYLEPQSVPAELDYDMWLGPAPYKLITRIAYTRLSVDTGIMTVADLEIWGSIILIPYNIY